MMFFLGKRQFRQDSYDSRAFVRIRHRAVVFSVQPQCGFALRYITEGVTILRILYTPATPFYLLIKAGGRTRDTSFFSATLMKSSKLED